MPLGPWSLQDHPPLLWMDIFHFDFMVGYINVFYWVVDGFHGSFGQTQPDGLYGYLAIDFFGPWTQSSPSMYYFWYFLITYYLEVSMVCSLVFTRPEEWIVTLLGYGYWVIGT